MNDLDLKQWRSYDHLRVDSLWIIERREGGAVPFHGAFLPEIPRQMIERYTRKGDVVIDPFCGTGTTLIECQRMGRHGLGVDINAEAIRITYEALQREPNPDCQSNIELVQSDAGSVDYRKYISELGGGGLAQLIILHPPYEGIVKFTDSPLDLSNLNEIEFRLKLHDIIDALYEVLAQNGHMVLVCGDVYRGGELIPLGFEIARYCTWEGRFKLKGIVVKNMGETRAKRGQKSLWRYRALRNGTFTFAHEYIFVLQRRV